MIKFGTLKHIYTIVFGILSIIFIFTVILEDVPIIDAGEYYFFLANRHKDTYLYTSTNLDIKAEPEGYIKRPSYIFENKLLFLYYGYIVSLQKTFSPLNNLSFDIYPERIFKKMYSLDGKIISFSIDVLRSTRGIYTLEYKLDLSDKNRCTARFIFKNNEGKAFGVTEKILERKFSMPFIRKMHFEIVSRKNDIILYINKQFICKRLIEDNPEEGLFRLVKFSGSQFQLDNLKITDFKTGNNIIKEDFDKNINLFDIRDSFLSHQRAAFFIMLFMLFVSGYVFDLLALYLCRLFKSKALLLEFIIPQSLFLMVINYLCSLSFEPVFYVLFSIICAKMMYIKFYLFKNRLRVG